MRSKQQWLEMIARTRPSAFAAHALETQLRREAAGLSAAELKEVQRAIDSLSARALSAQPREPLERPRAALSVEYRPEGMGGKGRIYAEIEGRPFIDLLEHPTLDAAQVYVFFDQQRLAGFQVDKANTLAERLESVVSALETLDLERVDCAELGLEQASLAEVLRAIVKNRS